MQRYVDEGKIAGLVTLLLRRGQVFHTGCYGLADRERNIPMQPDTLFRLWSVTKAITTVAALTLYEQGHFALDQDIAEFIPAFRDTQVYAGMDGGEARLVAKDRPITIRHLLTHTSGIVSGWGADTLPYKKMDDLLRTLPKPGAALADVVERIAQVPLVAQPGTLWHYGHSFEVIARLVEVLSGQTFAAYLQEHIFGPLGMVDSGYVVNAERLNRFSAFYAPAEDGGLKLIEAPDKSIHYLPDGVIPPDVWTPGGYGLVSSPADLLRFAHMLLNRGALDGARILAPRTVDLMAANHLPPALLPYSFPGAQPMRGYGHGLGVHALMDHGLAGVPCANGEYWKDGGSGTLFWVDPHYELTGVVLYQLDPFWVYPIFAKVKTLAYQAID